jgi:hypothetical protein
MVFAIGGNFGVEELQRDFLADLFVQDFINTAHTPFSQFFDDLVSFGESASRG